MDFCGFFPRSVQAVPCPQQPTTRHYTELVIIVTVSLKDNHLLCSGFMENSFALAKNSQEVPQPMSEFPLPPRLLWLGSPSHPTRAALLPWGTLLPAPLPAPLPALCLHLFQPCSACRCSCTLLGFLWEHEQMQTLPRVCA